MSEIKEVIKKDLNEILKYVRVALIPAEIIIKKIYPASKLKMLIQVGLDLINLHDLFTAVAFQAAPDCFKEEQ